MMSRIRPSGRRLLAVLALGVTTASLAGAAPIACRFDVEVPPGTPIGDTVYLIGNHAAIGAWKGSGVALQPAGSGKFRFQGNFPAGTSLEFKFTRGDFSRVEKTAAGHELPNRTLKVTGPVVAKFQVAAWADLVGAPAQPFPEVMP